MLSSRPHTPAMASAPPSPASSTGGTHTSDSPRPATNAGLSRRRSHRSRASELIRSFMSRHDNTHGASGASHDDDYYDDDDDDAAAATLQRVAARSASSTSSSLLLHSSSHVSQGSSINSRSSSSVCSPSEGSPVRNAPCTSPGQGSALSPLQGSASGSQESLRSQSAKFMPAKDTWYALLGLSYELKTIPRQPVAPEAVSPPTVPGARTQRPKSLTMTRTIGNQQTLPPLFEIPSPTHANPQSKGKANAQIPSPDAEEMLNIPSSISEASSSASAASGATVRFSDQSRTPLFSTSHMSAGACLTPKASTYQLAIDEREEQEDSIEPATLTSLSMLANGSQGSVPNASAYARETLPAQAHTATPASRENSSSHGGWGSGSGAMSATTSNETIYARCGSNGSGNCSHTSAIVSVRSPTHSQHGVGARLFRRSPAVITSLPADFVPLGVIRRGSISSDVAAGPRVGGGATRRRASTGTCRCGRVMRSVTYLVSSSASGGRRMSAFPRCERCVSAVVGAAAAAAAVASMRSESGSAKGSRNGSAGVAVGATTTTAAAAAIPSLAACSSRARAKGAAVSARTLPAIDMGIGFAADMFSKPLSELMGEKRGPVQQEITHSTLSPTALAGGSGSRRRGSDIHSFSVPRRTSSFIAAASLPALAATGKIATPSSNVIEKAKSVRRLPALTDATTPRGLHSHSLSLSYSGALPCSPSHHQAEGPSHSRTRSALTNFTASASSAYGGSPHYHSLSLKDLRDVMDGRREAPAHLHPSFPAQSPFLSNDSKIAGGSKEISTIDRVTSTALIPAWIESRGTHIVDEQRRAESGVTVAPGSAGLRLDGGSAITSRANSYGDAVAADDADSDDDNQKRLSYLSSSTCMTVASTISGSALSTSTGLTSPSLSMSMRIEAGAGAIVSSSSPRAAPTSPFSSPASSLVPLSPITTTAATFSASFTSKGADADIRASSDVQAATTAQPRLFSRV
ncbi:hypothetical protein K437DRAFT_91304 [Tilletiaria anomala UBC 951]|uniref:Uncharacterized protein n=1 Tax=Tilletiaria anomala (strain ATCC 24038 / CBS 436.72 / UBC 951) TaxID=1037660 RepID=A0A066W1Y0_TILAU|nr:uncharacterized protein K437DRAFT_91304 [Tilletiaria anomala UBC 951]KDN47726.1 hypothetical protein K437DRAFT_91304 [Tilletiaria anomala UBC 951]